MTIFFLLHRYLPDVFNKCSKDIRFMRLTDLDELHINLDQDEIDIVEEAFKGRLEELVAILRKSVTLKGVIIYYKQNVINREEVILGPEDDKDVIITTDSLLTLDDIEGVKFLSEEDQQIAFELIAGRKAINPNIYEFLVKNL